MLTDTIHPDAIPFVFCVWAAIAIIGLVLGMRKALDFGEQGYHEESQIMMKITAIAELGWAVICLIIII